MADVIIIPVDLDQKALDSSYSEIEEKSTVSGEVSAKKFSESFTESLQSSLKQAQVGKIIERSLAVGSISITALLILEREFKTLTKAAKLLGVNIDDVFDRFTGITKTLNNLKDTFDAFITGEKNFSDLKLAAALFGKELGFVQSNLLEFITLVQRGGGLALELADVAAATTLIGFSISPVIRNFADFRLLLSDIGKIALRPKGLFGVVSASATVATALGILGQSLDGVESKFLTVLQASLLLTAGLLGGFAAAISFAIVKFSELAIQIGSNLVAGFEKASDQFLKLNSEIKVLGATISAFNNVTDGSIGNLTSYTSLISDLSSNLNLLESDLAKAAREIIQVGSQLGFQEKQLQKLLVVSSEYAKINGKDVFDVAVAISGALNGQTQAVTSLGIKLGEASLQSFAFKKGLNQNFRTLATGTKAQLRYEKLLSQYNNVSGIAAARASSLGDAQNKLAAQVETINKSFGEGASIIERNNLATFAAGKALSVLNEEALFLAGIGGALVSRILQIGGAIVKLSFALFGARKGIELLDRALKSTISINAFGKALPFISKSLNELLSSASGSAVRVTNLSSLLKSLGSAISVSLLGTTGKGISAFKIFTTVVRTLTANIVTFGKVLIPLLAPFALIAAKIALLVGVLVILKSAFVAIEERTSAFTDLYKILLAALSETSGILQPLIDGFKSFGEAIAKIAKVAFGFFVEKLAQLVSAVAALAARNPFGVFSEKTVKALKTVEARLDGFRDKIKLAGFDLGKIPEIARAVAGKLDKTKFEVNLDQLAELRENFKNFGKGDIEVLRATLAQRLNLIKNAEMQGLISAQEAANVRRGLLQNFENEQTDVLANQALSFSSFASQVNAGLSSIAKQSVITGKTVASALVNGIGRGAGNAFAAFGAAIVSGENALEAFGKALLAAFGQSLVQLGTGFILQGVAQSLAGFGSGLPLIAAGAALATFGGVLSGVASGGAPSTQAGVGTGGSSAGIGTSPELPSLTDAEPEEPNTQVQVIVQGSIFDSEETGNRIASVLQKAALNNNVRIFGGIA